MLIQVFNQHNMSTYNVVITTVSFFQLNQRHPLYVDIHYMSLRHPLYVDIHYMSLRYPLYVDIHYM